MCFVACVGLILCEINLASAISRFQNLEAEDASGHFLAKRCTVKEMAVKRQRVKII